MRLAFYIYWYLQGLRKRPQPRRGRWKASQRRLRRSHSRRPDFLLAFPWAIRMAEIKDSARLLAFDRLCYHQVLARKRLQREGKNPQRAQQRLWWFAYLDLVSLQTLLVRTPPRDRRKKCREGKERESWRTGGQDGTRVRWGVEGAGKGTTGGPGRQHQHPSSAFTQSHSCSC